MQFHGSSERFVKPERSALGPLTNRVPLALPGGQLKAGETFHLTQKNRRLHLERTADVEDAAERGIGLSQFDQTDKGALIARLGGKSLLAHLLP